MVQFNKVWDLEAQSGASGLKLEMNL